MRDPYSVLGIKNTASSDDIKSAFRTMAKAVHPDTNRDDPSASSRFAEVGKAYDILKDPEKRSRYDLEQRLKAAKRGATIMEQRANKTTSKPGASTAKSSTSGSSGGSYAGSTSGASTNAYSTSSTSKASYSSGGGATASAAAQAQEPELENETAEDIISRIFGSGSSAKSAKGGQAGDATDGDSHGGDGSKLFAAADIFSGLLRKLIKNAPLPDKAPDLPVDAPVTIDEIFAGVKVTATLPDGKTLKVALPKGVVDGQAIRLPELGFRFPGMARGDVVATVRIQKHPLFQPDGHNLRTVVPVDIENAVLGCEAVVDTPKGTIKVDVPAWSGSDRVLELKGHGLPKEDGTRGDLLVELRLMLWDHPDSKVTDLMRALREGLFL